MYYIYRLDTTGVTLNLCTFEKSPVATIFFADLIDILTKFASIN